MSFKPNVTALGNCWNVSMTGLMRTMITMETDGIYLDFTEAFDKMPIKDIF